MKELSVFVDERGDKSLHARYFGSVPNVGVAIRSARAAAGRPRRSNHPLIIAAEMLRRSRLRCCGVPRCAATR